MKKLTVSIAEASELTGLSHSTLIRHMQAGRLPSALVGGRRLIRMSDLEAFIDAHMTDVA